MTEITCPACDRPILVVNASRWGGMRLPYDPEPGIGEHCDTMLAADLSHVIAASPAAKGTIPLYRNHRRSCTLKVPMDRALPDIGGYSHSRSVQARAS